MKKFIIALLALVAFAAPIEAKKMSDLKIYINPGHGGYDSDDRPIRIYPFAQSDTAGYWESKSNLYKGLHMYHILDSLGTKAMLSRIKNTSADDRSLSGIALEANDFGADLFFSIHTNAGEDVNFPIMLYHEETAGNPRYPENKTLSEICWRTLYSNKLPLWTRSAEYVSGDVTFYGWTNGLGVLRYLYTVGLLSEGAMHEHQPEAHRLMNDDYCWLEAWHFVRTIMEYFDTEDKFVTGNVAGIVYDDHNKREFVMPWNASAFGRDLNAPLNGATVELRDMAGNVVQKRTTDDMYNGVFVFRNVTPGNYKLYSVKDGYYAEEKDVTVTANEVTYQDMPLCLQRTGNLEIVSMTPVSGDQSVSCSSPITINFNYDVDTKSLEENATISPAVAGRWVYSKSYHVAQYIPDIALEKNTEYTITIPASVKSADTHNANANLANDVVCTFKTQDRGSITITGQYPKDGGLVHYKSPQIELRFDNKINQTSARNNIIITDSKNNKISLNARSCKFNQLTNGAGNALLVLSKDLTIGDTYNVTVTTDLRDEDNIPLLNEVKFSFKAVDVTADANKDAVVFDDAETTCNFKANAERCSGLTTTPGAKYTSNAIAGSRSNDLSYSYAEYHDGIAEWIYTGESADFNTGDVLSLYVNGDLSNHVLYAVISSGTNRKLIKVSELDFRGWQRFDLKLNELEADWCPFKFSGLQLVQVESPTTQKGSFQVDNISHLDAALVGTESLNAEGINVNVKGNTVTVNGPDASVVCSLYNTEGQQTTKFNVGSTATVEQGVYMLTVNGKTVKVVI